MALDAESHELRGRLTARRTAGLARFGTSDFRTFHVVLDGVIGVPAALSSAQTLGLKSSAVFDTAEMLRIW